jgi:HD-GYP domain-containing protein (c-di-GMP phosphodiesterase class II)
MFPAPLRVGRGLPLTLRVGLALTVASVFVAILVAFLGSERATRARLEAQAADELRFAQQLADRLSPMLDRGDLLRLSMLATAGHDLAGARVVVLDRTGRVALDTALALGDRQLVLLTLGGAFQRALEQGDERLRETLAPVRFGGDIIGEVRLQTPRAVMAAGFDFGLFGIVLLCCLSLVVVATLMAHHWSARVRAVTGSLVQLATGQLTSDPDEAATGELRDLGEALHELEKGVHDGLHRVVEGFVALAMQVVDSLERRNLVPTGHGERTARYAAQLAEKLALLPPDQRDLELACRVSDLGKAWLRPAILQRKELSRAEAEALRDHPRQGADLLECLPGLRFVAAMVRHQYERFDGCGYPDALRGERIPLGARVLAIASTFDLLTTCGEHRPLSWEAALQQMAEGRGEIYDPWLLDLFAAAIRSAPPLAPDRPVMILPGGSVPERPAGAIEAEDGLDYDLGAELEVMLDELPPEEPA